MIHKKKEFSQDAFNRLNYAAGGRGHEHKINGLVFVQGTMISELRFIEPDLSEQPDSVPGDASAVPSGMRENQDESGSSESSVAVDFSDLQNEFEAVAGMHCGKGEKLFGHYVISLAEGEMLTSDEWNRAMREYMSVMGYDETTKYCGFKHADSNCEHLHILSCRVQLKPGGPLVDDSNDFEKGMQAMRVLERKLGLQVVPNPHETWGVDWKKRDFKHRGGSREKVNESEDSGRKSDWASVIRGRLAKIWEVNKPHNMAEFARATKASGISIKIRTNRNGEPEGISYSVEGSGVWISGSKVKAARLTWQNLIKTEGISYDPHKHNLSLGLAPRPETLVRVDAFQLLNKRQAYVIERTKLPVRLYRHGDRYYAGFGFEQLLKTGKERYEEMIRDQLIQLVLYILELLFGCRQGRAGEPLLTNDMDIPSGLEVVKNDVGDEAWRIQLADDKRSSPKVRNEVGENLSEEILKIHEEWVSPRMERTRSKDNDQEYESTLLL
ncbi:relaxase/mobilization nuclease domain-containing protein [Marinobacter sp.]|uniref:relaxase/mobilization nuclease domain-containing protein n=1 Tax=Marinobacter sp. TaxID=50741 RepID=UPI0026351499|nr:relaxase/mobilization nuclease domain-containing protein [Marinobacter sp.]